MSEEKPTEEKPTRDHTAVLEDHQAAMKTYGALAQDPTSTQAALQAAAAKVKQLGQELSAAISAGAEPCKQCQAPPLGMLKTPGYLNAGLEVAPVYEVGCVFCAPVLISHDVRGVAIKVDGELKRMLRRSFSARANSPADAVRKWNAGEFVEDTFLDRIPGFVPQFAA